MTLRRSLSALTLAICTFSATGCDNWSFDLKTPGALEESGDRKYRAGDYEDAIDDYEQLIERYPDISRGYTRRSAARGKLGFHEEALKDVAKAIEIGTEDPWAYNNYAVLLLKSNGEPSEHFEEALKSVSRAIEINSEVPKFYFNRSIIRYNMKDLDGAMNDLTRILELDENYSDALRQRGSLFAELGIVPSACADWKKASSLGDTRSTHYLQENSEVCK